MGGRVGHRLSPCRWVDDSTVSDDPARTSSLPNASAESLIRRHQMGVWRYLRMLGCDEALADDLTQETLYRVLRRESFAEHNDAATAAYMRRTAYNLMVTFHRKGGRTRTVYTADPLDEVWSRWAGKDIAGDEAVDALVQCMQALTDRARLALKMRFTDDASRADIAATLEITEHGARNLMQRAKQQLRECVQSKLNDTPP